MDYCKLCKKLQKQYSKLSDLVYAEVKDNTDIVGNPFNRPTRLTSKQFKSMKLQIALPSFCTECFERNFGSQRLLVEEAVIIPIVKEDVQAAVKVRSRKIGSNVSLPIIVEETIAKTSTPLLTSRKRKMDSDIDSSQKENTSTKKTRTRCSRFQKPGIIDKSDKCIVIEDSDSEPSKLILQKPKKVRRTQKKVTEYIQTTETTPEELLQNVNSYIQRFKHEIENVKEQMTEIDRLDTERRTLEFNAVARDVEEKLRHMKKESEEQQEQQIELEETRKVDTEPIFIGLLGDEECAEDEMPNFMEVFPVYAAY